MNAKQQCTDRRSTKVEMQLKIMAVEKKEIKDVIRDFVFGMEDGLVSNLGLVLGVYVGGGGTFAVVLA